MKRLFTVFVLVFPAMTAVAQHQEINEKPGLRKVKAAAGDSTTLQSAFRRGTISGHFRYFFMATENSGFLSDYHAHAVGGVIRFKTARFKNMQLGVSGSFVFNIGSSDLAAPDTKTNQMNRYETGLFDIENPANRAGIENLEELYIRYHFKHAILTVGKQLLNTPFINLQDGRMQPTAVEGLWSEIDRFKKVKLHLGYFFGISPRSTGKWYAVDKSIGLYPAGVNTDGSRSGYRGNLESKGIFLAGITYQHSASVKLQFWDQFTENIFNSAFIQADYEYPFSKKSNILAAVQFIRQDGVKNGGNEDPARAYFRKGGQSNSVGARIGWKNDHWETTLNYQRITAGGRYLMPREWGRDPFFTFLPRERNEGLGDVQAVVAKLSYRIPARRFSSSIAFGKYTLPDVTNDALNKYGLPSYDQLNIDLQYQFTGFLKGLETQLLYVYKGGRGNTYGNDKYVINKVDMSLWNLVFNYQF